MFKEIYKAIKKYDNIVIARHIGADIDALGSQIALKTIIESNFPLKKVYAVGAYSSKFKYMGSLDKELEKIEDNTLLIVLDTPIIRRLDGVEGNDFKYKIKIDHHPFEEKFCDIELIDEHSSSTCELIVDLVKNTKLKMNKYAAERLYMGIIADTNRFLYPCSSPKTMQVSAGLISEYDIDKKELYENMYMRNLDEVRFSGYVLQNLKVTKNGVGYISITDDIQKQFGVDAASAGNMVNELTFINELLVWLTFSEDKKQGIVRVSVRSRGPVINTIAMQYNGGGHKLASGIRLQDFSLVDEIVSRLDLLCKEYIDREQDLL